MNKLPILLDMQFLFTFDAIFNWFKYE